jgi:drug/metabolite transporter (DMT)-like permease
MNVKLYGYVLLSFALLFTAVVPIAYVLGNGINPITLMLLVSLVGTSVSFMVAYSRRTLKHVKTYFTTGKGILTLLSFGLLAYAGISLIFSYVTHFVSADLLAVVYRSWPLILILMAPKLLREHVTKYDIAGVVIGFSALAATLLGGTAISIPIRYLPFVLLLLVAAVLDAFVSGISKRYNYELTSSIFAYNLVALIVFSLLSIFTGSLNLSGVSGATVIGVLILGIVQNVLLTFLFVAAFRSVKTSIAGNVFIASPFFTMLFSWVFLGTRIEPYYLLIAFGVAFGVLVQSLQPRRSNYIPVTKDILIYDVTSAFVNSKSEIISDAIKWENRALAFVVNRIKLKEATGAGLHVPETPLLFTEENPDKEIREEELNFIKDIIHPKDDETIVIGIGKPLEIEQKFTEISNKLSDQENSVGQFV